MAESKRNILNVDDSTFFVIQSCDFESANIGYFDKDNGCLYRRIDLMKMKVLSKLRKPFEMPESTFISAFNNKKNEIKQLCSALNGASP